MTADDLGGHPILRVEYFQGAPLYSGVNFEAVAWSEKRQQRLLLSTWITPELASDLIALRVYLMGALEDAEDDDSAQEARS